MQNNLPPTVTFPCSCGDALQKSINNQGEAPLVLAAQAGHATVVKTLLQGCADVNFAQVGTGEKLSCL